MIYSDRDWWGDYPLHQPGRSGSARWLDFVAVDPGVTTGLVAGTVSPVALKARGSEAFGAADALLSGCQVECPSGPFFQAECQQVNEIMSLGMSAFSALSNRRSLSGEGHPEVRRIWIIEDFTLRERTADRSLLSPVRLTSMIVDRLQQHMDTFDVVVQSPNDKSIVKDDMIKKRGLWVPGRQHSMDATRHAMLFLRKVKVR